MASLIEKGCRPKTLPDSAFRFDCDSNGEETIHMGGLLPGLCGARGGSLQSVITLQIRALLLNRITGNTAICRFEATNNC